ncbi:DUF4249 family protein [Flavobacterium laiguense]|uniref:DUF4249 domain-containing protein n=1 Tax=Flavobacterium laiguense TaxID=2169409 RepID=A0A2U1JV29_9FLAO|nr:DUF4249 family protein [Flavobacterium laiguense]PWA08794.1 DUF4249 domain-containing protein [Flavobacterium laiguense]
MKKNYFLLVLVLLWGCNTVDYTEEVVVVSKIVVQGYIEEGDVSHVILSTSIPIGSTVDSLSILKHLILLAKVTVSDGTNSEELSLRFDKNWIPPLVYTGKDLVGKSGKTYSLKVEYEGRVIESSTTIPTSVPIRELNYVKDNPADTTGYVFVKFEDPVGEKNQYQILTKVDKKEAVFVPAFYGNLNDDDFSSPVVNFQINRGVLMFSSTKFRPYFTDGDFIFVKLRTMDKASFDFWNDYQNEIVNGVNPIFPANTSLKSNIVGGIGIWAGYGVSVVSLQTP